MGLAERWRGASKRFRIPFKQALARKEGSTLDDESLYFQGGEAPGRVHSIGWLGWHTRGLMSCLMFACAVLLRAVLGLMVGKIGFSYEPIQAFPTRQGCTPESYELVATFISV